MTEAKPKTDKNQEFSVFEEGCSQIYFWLPFSTTFQTVVKTKKGGLTLGLGLTWS